MTWSRAYSGDKTSVVAKARQEQAEVEALVPEFERGDIAPALAAAEAAVAAIPAEAEVTLRLHGHGWRSPDALTTDRTGAGAITIQVEYALPYGKRKADAGGKKIDAEASESASARSDG